MFKNEYLESLEIILGYEKDTLVNAAKGETAVEVAAPTIKAFTEDKLTEFKTNLIEQSRKGIIEVAIKDFAKEQSIELTQGDRNLTELLKVHKAKVVKEAKIKPEEKEKEFQAALKIKTEEITTLKGNIEKLTNDVFTGSVKASAIGGIKSKTIIPKDNVYQLFILNKATPVKLENGTIGAKDNISGEIIKDSNLSPLKFADVFNSFVDDAYISTNKEEEESRGGLKDKDGVLIFDSMDEWEKHYSDDNTTIEATKSLEASAKKDNFKV